MQTLSLALVLILGQTPTTADTWPQWRGPTGDSVTPAKKLPMKWSQTENIVWKVKVPGRGNSTPVIWKDALFLTAQQDDRLTLLRLDRTTGKTVWEKEVGQGTLRRQGPLGNGRF